MKLLRPPLPEAPPKYILNMHPLNLQGAVIVIGGGIIGSFVAYFLRREGYAGAIRVIERDSTYQYSSTALSAASIRTQFGCEFNVRMSLFGAEMFRQIHDWFGNDANIGYDERGYLILGSLQAAAGMRAGALKQNELGAAIDILTPAQAHARFPWLNVEDIEIATYGAANEGWFDAWALLQLVRREARRLGVEYVEAEAVGIEQAGQRVTGVRLADGRALAADWCVNAAGAAGGKVAAMLGIELPVRARKRTVFHVKTPLESHGFPMLFDNSGAWIRPEGEGYIAGIAPDESNDPDADGDFEPDYALLEDSLWLKLAHRVPAFESLRLLRAWAGHYEVNLLDHNGVLGPHDEISNFLFATGFSGHGLMHAPAAGRAIAEQIVHGAFRALDLAPLGYGRIRRGEPIVESIVY